MKSFEQKYSGRIKPETYLFVQEKSRNKRIQETRVFGNWSRVQVDISQYKRMSKDDRIIVRFDTETARANSIVFIIRLLIGFVIGVYDRTLQYSNLFLGIQHGFLLHEFPHLKYIHVRPRKIAGRSNSHFLMKKKYVVNWLTETVILLGARLKLRDVFLEAFTSIITISSGCSLGIQYLEPSYSTFYREWFSET